MNSKCMYTIFLTNAILSMEYAITPYSHVEPGMCGYLVQFIAFDSSFLHYQSSGNLVLLILLFFVSIQFLPLLQLMCVLCMIW